MHSKSAWDNASSPKIVLQQLMMVIAPPPFGCRPVNYRKSYRCREGPYARRKIQHAPQAAGSLLCLQLTLYGNHSNQLDFARF